MARPQAPRLPDLRLKIRVHGRHPWFYRKMIQKPELPLPAGTPAVVKDKDGKLLKLCMKIATSRLKFWNVATLFLSSRCRTSRTTSLLPANSGPYTL